MGEVRVVYTPHAGATLEGELVALVNAFSFLRQCAEEQKKGGPATAPDDGTKIKGDSAYGSIIPNRPE